VGWSRRGKMIKEYCAVFEGDVGMFGHKILRKSIWAWDEKAFELLKAFSGDFILVSV
jgi:hypothetical protein